MTVVINAEERVVSNLHTKRTVRTTENKLQSQNTEQNPKSKISEKEDSIVISIVSDNKAVLQWTKYLEDIKLQTIKYGQSPWELKEAIILSKTDRQVILPDLKPNTRYYYQIEIEFEQPQTKKSVFPNPPGLIKTASEKPKLNNNKFTDIKVFNTASDTVTLEFSTTEYSVFEILHGTNKNRLTEKIVINFYSKNGKINFAKPQHSRNYYYSIKATDVFNNVIESGIREFK